MTKTANISELYFEILKIGVENLEKGVTLIELKEHINKDFLIFEQTINSYFSILFQPVDKNVLQQGVLTYWGNSPDHIEILNKNKHRLTHELSIEFIKLTNSKTQIDLLQSQLKTTAQNAQDAKKESSWAFRIAISSMVLTGSSLLIDTLNYKNGVNEQIQSNTSQLKTIQETTSKQQIEATKKIYNLLDSLHQQTSIYKITPNKATEGNNKSLKTQVNK